MLGQRDVGMAPLVPGAAGHPVLHCCCCWARAQPARPSDCVLPHQPAAAPRVMAVNCDGCGDSTEQTAAPSGKETEKWSAGGLRFNKSRRVRCSWDTVQPFLHLHSTASPSASLPSLSKETISSGLPGLMDHLCALQFLLCVCVYSVLALHSGCVALPAFSSSSSMDDPNPRTAFSPHS